MNTNIAREFLDTYGKWTRDRKGKIIRKIELNQHNIRQYCLIQSYFPVQNFELISFQLQKNKATYTPEGILKLAGFDMPITEWVFGFKEILEDIGYTEKQIKAYGLFIKMCAKTL